MNERNKKLAEWRGFKFSHICRDPDDWWFGEEVYHLPCDKDVIGTVLIPDFTNDLNACLEHLEPELYRRGLRYQLMRLQDGHRAIIFAHRRAWAEIVADAVAEKPATAFCKAIEQIVEKE